VLPEGLASEMRGNARLARGETLILLDIAGDFEGSLGLGGVAMPWRPLCCLGKDVSSLASGPDCASTVAGAECTFCLALAERLSPEGEGIGLAKALLAACTSTG
jgi:hypothetical protein